MRWALAWDMRCDEPQMSSFMFLVCLATIHMKSFLLGCPATRGKFRMRKDRGEGLASAVLRDET